MPAPLLRLLPMLAALAAFPATAQAAPSAPASTAEADSHGGDPSQDLYQAALQSIAEGRKNDASNMLLRVIEQVPLHAGAWLDLALLQCSLGNSAEADRLFTIIEQRFDPPPGILQVIADTRTNGCGQWTPLSQYTVSIARGIDQNVNQGSRNDFGIDSSLSPEFRPQHDQYSVLSGEYMRDLTPNGMLGFVQFQGRRNDRLHQYDSASLFAGAEAPWRLGNWTVRGSALAGLVTLGSALYQRQYQVQARVGPPVPLPYSLQFHLVASLSHSDYVTLQNFDANTSELRGQLSRNNGVTALNAGLGVQRDHAIAARPGGDRSGMLASLQWRHRYSDGFTADLGYSLQSWHGSAPYNAGVIDQIRHQRTHVLRATGTWRLGRNHNLLLEGRQVVNKENIPIFQYNSRQLQISWQWQGP